MNDGVGLISPQLMRRVQEILGLPATTCAIQARIGSAKGMWITAHDERGNGSADWIEIYPSQEKWACNWANEDHRTLEVKGWASELKPATLNTQFLAILDDRSVDRRLMRKVITQRLVDELDQDLEYMKSSLHDPAQLRKWLHELSSHHGGPFLAGLPDSNSADVLSFLVDGGFDPMKLKYLSDLVYKIQEERSKKLGADLKIKIARSTYAYMVVDFPDVLQPDEVHVCFSTPFGNEGIYDLDGLDVLLARNPAHLPGDIQKVKAVFKPELRHLKDVIVFPLKGDVPLAQKLSGGDYDGDRAWICWDPDIVSCFQNTTVKPEDVLPPEEIRSSIFDWNETSVEALISSSAEGNGLDNLIEEGLSFGLKRSLLGICTSYKVKFCDERNCISDRSSILLSWLLAELADEAKKGVIFKESHWSRFKREILEPACMDAPPPGRDQVGHINDHLKSAATSAVKKALAELNRFMMRGLVGPERRIYTFDADIANYWNQVESRFSTPTDGPTSSPWFSRLHKELKDDIAACAEEWSRLVLKRTAYRSGALQVYERWRNIQPRTGHIDPQIRAFVSHLLLPGFVDPEISPWELLKASLTFKLYYNNKPNFVWRIAGRQLQFIKAFGGSSRTQRCPACCLSISGEHAGCRNLPVPVIPHVYEALKPNNKYIAKARAGGEGMSWDNMDDDD